MPDTRLIIVMSDGGETGKGAPFTSFFDNSYAARFAAHFKDATALTVAVPSVMPQYLDDPADYLPEKLPAHDVLIAINVHEEILLELPRLVGQAGGQAIVVPRENPDWTSPWVRDELAKRCSAGGLEAVFPKPFCSLAPDPGHPVVNRMIEDLKIGRPKVKITVADGVITGVEVLRSAPCGDTYYVAKNLPGKPAAEAETWAFKYWASYPCLGGMAFDPEYNDMLQHVAGHILLEAVREGLDL